MRPHAVVEGIRWSLAAALALIALVFAAGFAYFPRGHGGLADAAREAGRLEREETAGSGL